MPVFFFFFFFLIIYVPVEVSAICLYITYLLHELHNYGITGHVFSWVKDFLADRKQPVIINGSKSEWVNLTSGIHVPQGSVLRPTLFLVFINDLPDAMTICMKLFADDGKIFSKVKHRRIDWLSKVM